MGGKTEDEETKELEPAEGSEGGMSTAAEEAEILAALNSVQPDAQAEPDQGMHTTASPVEALEPAGEPGLPKGEVPLPPAESTTGALPFSPEAYEEPSPTDNLEIQKTPLQKDALPADPKLVRFFIKDERLNKLWGRADGAKERLDIDIHTIETGRILLDQIKYARNYLLAGRDYYEDAERHVNEVEFTLNQNLQSRKWSLSYGIPLFIYEIVWGTAFIALYLALETSAFSVLQESTRVLLGTMFWGGIGGVAGALLALIKHTSQEQDFDKQHSLWYLSSPLMGAVLGSIIYLVMSVGVISITSGRSTITSPEIIYLLSGIAGFQHNVFTSIVKRAIKIFETGTTGSESGGEEKSTETSAPPPPPSSSMLVVPEEGPSKKG
jgi:hypothetical protein